MDVGKVKLDAVLVFVDRPGHSGEVDTGSVGFDGFGSKAFIYIRIQGRAGLGSFTGASFRLRRCNGHMIINKYPAGKRYLYELSCIDGIYMVLSPGI